MGSPEYNYLNAIQQKQELFFASRKLFHIVIDGNTAHKMMMGAGVWVKGKGEKTKTCDTTCLDRGLVCDVSELNKLTTETLVRDAFQKAGYTCPGIGGDRSYAGAPFHKKKDKDCYYLTPGKTATCSSKQYDTHAPLCFCKMSDFTYSGTGYCSSGYMGESGQCANSMTLSECMERCRISDTCKAIAHSPS